jgi:hypothetical protein
MRQEEKEKGFSSSLPILLIKVCFLLASNETGGEGENQRGGEGETFLFFFPLSKEPYLYLSSVRKRRKTIRKRRGR